MSHLQGLSHLKEYQFTYSFQDSINPLCACGYEAEFTNENMAVQNATTEFILITKKFDESLLKVKLLTTAEIN